MQLRLKNALREGSTTVNNTPIPPGCTITDVIEQCAAAGRTNDERRTTKGKHDGRRSSLVVGHGFACGHKNIGFSFGAPESCEATVELRARTERVGETTQRFTIRVEG